MTTKLCISFAVRLMIVSSTRTGSIGEGIAEAAHDIFSKHYDEGSSQEEIGSSKSFYGTFLIAFETATVSNRKFTWYYLRSTKLSAKGEKEP